MAFQDDLVQSVEKVIASATVPPEIAHYMLDMTEDMERNKSPLPIAHSLMAHHCFNLQAYAKALHHRELQFFKDQGNHDTVESLIEINAMLRQSDAALGTLNLACQLFRVDNPVAWYEKLGQWDEAALLYNEMERNADEGTRQQISLGKLRCFHALGEWNQALQLTSNLWQECDTLLRAQIAPIGAAAAWHTEMWSDLETYWSAMDRSSGDRAFYSAVSSIQKNRLPSALSNISLARDLLDPELTSLLDESPDRLDR